MLGRKDRRQLELFVAGARRDLLADDHILVRLMLAGLLLGIIHDRRLLRAARVNLAIHRLWPARKLARA